MRITWIVVFGVIAAVLFAVNIQVALATNTTDARFTFATIIIGILSASGLLTTWLSADSNRANRKLAKTLFDAEVRFKYRGRAIDVEKMPDHTEKFYEVIGVVPGLEEQDLYLLLRPYHDQTYKDITMWILSRKSQRPGEVADLYYGAPVEAGNVIGKITEDGHTRIGFLDRDGRPLRSKKPGDCVGKVVEKVGPNLGEPEGGIENI